MSNTGMNISHYAHVGEPDDSDGEISEERWRAMMEAGSRKLSLALGIAWPCNHKRTPENTHRIGEVVMCKTCRRRRWNRGFKIAARRVELRREIARRQGATLAKHHQDAMRELLLRPGNGRFPLDIVLSGVARFFGLTVDDLKSKCRKAGMRNARSVVAKILHERGVSYPGIGRILGGRDHSTVMWSVSNFDSYASRDLRVLDAYDAMRDKPNG